jgi:beta-N-acetylhexosaminidase
MHRQRRERPSARALDRIAALIRRTLTLALAVAATLVATLARANVSVREHAAGRGASNTEWTPRIRSALPPLQRMLGQRIMVGFNGTSANPHLLAEIRAGNVGDVILFGANITSDSQAQALIASLQAAARAGGNPPLIVAIDQEGGEVKRFSSAPPTLSPPQMAASGRPAVAYSQGLATGHFLKHEGVNMDLAPVVDVPLSGNSFIWQEGRAFSMNANTVARYASQFARGVQAAGVAATAKHFPGVGSAPVDTDNQLDTLRPTAHQLAQALIPYRTLIPEGLDTVMLSTAAFPAYDRSGTVAALSHQMIAGLLRTSLGFKGVTITDSLNSPDGHNEIIAGALAAQAGADILLFVDDAPGELAALLRAAHRGSLSPASIESSYARIVALKQRLAGT